jgi:hypothetical protein
VYAKLKCCFHPELEAVVVCKSCGRGLCDDCAITISNQTFCRECIEKGIATPTVSTAPKPVPTPTGVPNRAFFIVGGIGTIMNVVAAILLLFVDNLFLGRVFYQTSLIDLVVVILLFTGILLMGIGYLGIRRNYGSSMGIASFIMGLITGILFLVKWVIGFIAYGPDVYFYDYYDSPLYIFWISLFIIAWVIFGVSQIIWGATHIVTRKFVISGLSLATGIMLIIAGAFSISVLLSPIGAILFAVSEILATIVFFTAKIPKMHP